MKTNLGLKKGRALKVFNGESKKVELVFGTNSSVQLANLKPRLTGAW